MSAGSKPLKEEGGTSSSADKKEIMYEPISRLPRNVPKTPGYIFYPKIIFFIFATLFFSTLVILAMTPALFILAIRYPLRFLLPKSIQKQVHVMLYRIYKYNIRVGQIAFTSYLVAITSLYLPGTFVITGETDDMAATAKSVVMANHQIYPDWIYLWILAYFHGHQANIKIMLMDVLKYAPIVGLGVILFEFVLMKRKLALDRNTIHKMLSRQREYIPDLPLWFLLFPEGTLNTPNNRVTSRAFAKKNEIPFDPSYVILPKAMGLFMCCDLVGSEVDTLFDITVGYGGIEAEDIPYEEYLVENCYGSAKYPKEVHFHIKKFKISELPGFNEPGLKRPFAAPKGSDVDVEKEATRRDAFSIWLRNRFMEKDQLMDHFYKTGGFPNLEFVSPSSEANGVTNWFPKTKEEELKVPTRTLKQVRIKLQPDWTDLVMILAVLIQGYYTLPIVSRWTGYLVWYISSSLYHFVMRR